MPIHVCSGFGRVADGSTTDGSSIGDGNSSGTERLEADAIGKDELHIGQADDEVVGHLARLIRFEVLMFVLV